MTEALTAADADTLVALDPSYVDYCLSHLGASRVFGLAPEAVRHLQRSLDFLFARHAREDHAWPSRADLELKLTWLDQAIARGSARQSEYKAERDLLRSLLQSGAAPENEVAPVLAPSHAGADSAAGPEPEARSPASLARPRAGRRSPPEPFAWPRALAPAG